MGSLPTLLLRTCGFAAAAALALAACADASSDEDRVPTRSGSASSASAGPTTSAVRTTAARPASPSTTTTTRPPAPSRGTPRPRATPTSRVTPKPTPKATPKPATGTSVVGQVLSLVNAERAKAGCGPVRTSSALQRAAQGHSADMAAKDYFSHTSKDGRTFADRIRAAGYAGGTIGENIAAGQATASAVMRSWMGSAGHRANILNCSFTALGVGHGRGGSYGHYWTQDFGG